MKPPRWSGRLAVAAAVFVTSVALGAAFPAVLRIPRRDPNAAPVPAPALFSHRTHGSFGCYACHPSRVPAGPGRLHARRDAGGAILRPLPRRPHRVSRSPAAVCARCHVDAALAAGRFAWRCSALLPAGIVRAQTPQEKKRGDILKDLGPQEEAAGAAARGRRRRRPRASRPRRAAKSASASGGRRRQSRRARARALHRAGPAAPSFGRVVHPLFVSTCKACHAPGAPGGASRLLLSGDAAADHHAIARFVNTRDPEASVLLGKVSGATMHAGGAPWPAAGAQYQRVLAWIRGGARLDAAAKAEPVAEAPAPHAARPAVAAPTGDARRPGSQPAAPVAVPPAAGEPAARCAAGRRGRAPSPRPAPAIARARTAKPSAPRFAATRPSRADERLRDLSPPGRARPR